MTELTLLFNFDRVQLCCDQQSFCIFDDRFSYWPAAQHVSRAGKKLNAE